MILEATSGFGLNAENPSAAPGSVSRACGLDDVVDPNLSWAGI